MVEVPDMTGEALDIRKIMGGDQDRGPLRTFQYAPNQLVAYQRIETCKWFVEDN